MDLKSFAQAIQQIADEKGISKEKIFETIEMALASAYKRDYGKRGQIIRASFDPQTGKATFRQIKIVVDESMIKSEEEIQSEEEERARLVSGQDVYLVARGGEEQGVREGKDSVREPRGLPEAGEEDEAVVPEAERKARFNPEKHLMIEEARAIKADVMPGEELEFSLSEQEEYGRIAAQTAKQVIIQRLREAEREAVYEEYKGREGELVSGIVQRVEANKVFLDIGRAVGMVPPEEQIPGERYRIGQRLKALVILVEKNPKGPGVFLSRTHPKLLKKLFEVEVPEVAAGTVEIKAVAREPGSRSKVAAVSHERGVDPVGALVGQKGMRVFAVIQELGGEKIDVIEWSEDPAEFIAHALSPAKVVEVILRERRREAQAIVPEEQLSLAIGRSGQNVRLAAKLTGWRFDVRSDKSKKKKEDSGSEDEGERETAEVEGKETVEQERESQGVASPFAGDEASRQEPSDDSTRGEGD